MKPHLLSHTSYSSMLISHMWLVAPGIDSTDLEPSLIAESSFGQHHVRSANVNTSETRVNHVR